VRLTQNFPASPDFDILIYGCYTLSYMESNTVAKTEAATDADVMASVEAGQEDTFIIADVSTDGAYLTLPLDEAASLPAWR